MKDSIIDFFNYIQPIINACAGFIKTDGYMMYKNGVLIMMDSEEMYCSIIILPIVHDISITAKINTFMSLKTDEDRCNYLSLLYFTGWNIKEMKLQTYFLRYSDLSKYKCVYNEPNCYNINGFDEAVGKSTIDNVKIVNDYRFYIIPVSRAITPLTKQDRLSIYIYNDTITNILHYSMYKKKFNIVVNIYCNII